MKQIKTVYGVSSGGMLEHAYTLKEAVKIARKFAKKRNYAEIFKDVKLKDGGNKWVEDFYLYVGSKHATYYKVGSEHYKGYFHYGKDNCSGNKLSDKIRMYKEIK